LPFVLPPELPLADLVAGLVDANELSLGFLDIPLQLLQGLRIHPRRTERPVSLELDAGPFLGLALAAF